MGTGGDRDFDWKGLRVRALREDCCRTTSPCVVQRCDCAHTSLLRSLSRSVIRLRFVCSVLARFTCCVRGLCSLTSGFDCSLLQHVGDGDWSTVRIAPSSCLVWWGSDHCQSFLALGSVRAPLSGRTLGLSFGRSVVRCLLLASWRLPPLVSLLEALVP